MIPFIPRNYLSENEILTNIFSGECALITVKELKRLKDIENKYNSIESLINK